MARPNLNPRFWDSVSGSSNHVLAGDSRKRILMSPQPLESPFDPNRSCSSRAETFPGAASYTTLSRGMTFRTNMSGVVRNQHVLLTCQRFRGRRVRLWDPTFFRNSVLSTLIGGRANNERPRTKSSKGKAKRQRGA